MALNPKEVLKQIFGYEEFRQGQNKIISSIVNNNAKDLAHALVNKAIKKGSQDNASVALIKF